MGNQTQKGNMYLHQRVEKNLEDKLRVNERQNERDNEYT